MNSLKSTQVSSGILPPGSTKSKVRTRTTTTKTATTTITTSSTTTTASGATASLLDSQVKSLPSLPPIPSHATSHKSKSMSVKGKGRVSSEIDPLKDKSTRINQYEQHEQNFRPIRIYNPDHPRCIGITKQGRQCLNTASREIQYCHLHIDQDERLITMLNSLSISTRSISPGYIYVYTLESGHKNVHVYDHQKKAFVRLPISDRTVESTKLTTKTTTVSRTTTSTKTKQSTTSTKRNFLNKIFQSSSKTNFHSKDSSKSASAVLVKVGQTSKTPTKRLSEWRKKCQHPIHLLAPPSEAISSKSFDYSKQGWPTNQARPTEAAIHTELRALFGKGHVECSGCKENGRHNEWFLVPADKVSILYKTIHYWVELYKNDQPD